VDPLFASVAEALAKQARKPAGGPGGGQFASGGGSKGGKKMTTGQQARYRDQKERLQMHLSHRTLARERGDPRLAAESRRGAKEAIREMRIARGDMVGGGSGKKRKSKPVDTPASLTSSIRNLRSAMHFSARVGDKVNLEAQRTRTKDLIARHRALVPKKPKAKRDPWKERQDEHDTWRDEARFRTQTGFHRGFRPGLPRS